MTADIIDPTGGRDPIPSSGSDAPRPERLAGLRVGLLENGKRNAAQVLDAIGRVIDQRHAPGEIVPRTKTQFAMPLPEDVVDGLKRDCDVVVIGVGDCGSCSAAAVADAIRLEHEGIPTAVICTEVFEATSRAMAELKGDGDHPVILMPHPIANLTDAQIAERAQALAEAVTTRLLTRRPGHPTPSAHPMIGPTHDRDDRIRA